MLPTPMMPPVTTPPAAAAIAAGGATAVSPAAAHRTELAMPAAPRVTEQALAPAGATWEPDAEEGATSVYFAFTSDIVVDPTIFPAASKILIESS